MAMSFPFYFPHSTLKNRHQRKMYTPFQNSNILHIKKSIQSPEIHFIHSDYRNKGMIFLSAIHPDKYCMYNGLDIKICTSSKM
jgi:hypothetical protein